MVLGGCACQNMFLGISKCFYQFSLGQGRAALACLTSVQEIGLVQNVEQARLAVDVHFAFNSLSYFYPPKYCGAALLDACLKGLC